MKKVAVFFIIFFIMITLGFPGPEGKFEIGFHYSYWSIDMIAPIIEDMTPNLAYYDPDKGDIHFTSNGNNLGFAVRFFPKGKKGSFSIGLSYERNNFKAKAEGAYTATDPLGYKLDAKADGNLELLPHSVNINLRWELFPKAKVHPYLGFGFGFGALYGYVNYYTKEIIYTPTGNTVREKNEEWTLKELIAEYEQTEGKSFPLSFFPIVHLNFGIRGEIVENLYLLGEIAIYNGLIFRGGLAYRFR